MSFLKKIKKKTESKETKLERMAKQMIADRSMDAFIERSSSDVDYHVEAIFTIANIYTLIATMGYSTKEVIEMNNATKHHFECYLENCITINEVVTNIIKADTQWECKMSDYQLWNVPKLKEAKDKLLDTNMDYKKAQYRYLRALRWYHILNLLETSALVALRDYAEFDEMMLRSYLQALRDMLKQNTNDFRKCVIELNKKYDFMFKQQILYDSKLL